MLITLSKASAKVRGFYVISKFFGDFFQKKCVFLFFMVISYAFKWLKSMH